MERETQRVDPEVPIDPSTLRIMDANLNRAREALRVMEEHARFHLNDAILTQATKETRHQLRRIADTFEGLSTSGLAVAHRDVLGDVGREIGIESEYSRTDSDEVVRAAAKRLPEALRVLEEYAKTIATSLAVSFEELRYQAYDLERRLVLTGEAQRRFGGVYLYVLLIEQLCKNDWLETARAVLEGGADCLQLREKNLNDRDLLERARVLSSMCKEHQALFIVNDRPDIARLCNADGVHLGQDDLTVSVARRVLPAGMLVGVSTHTEEQIQEAVTHAPDYIAVGPMYPTKTKPQDHIAGPETLAAAGELTSLPLVAIGGIDEANLDAVLKAGPATICVSRAAISHHDPCARASLLRSIILESRSPEKAI